MILPAASVGSFPNEGLFAYDKQENAISALYNRLQESKETPDVSEMLQALYEVVDTAVTTEIDRQRPASPLRADQN